MQLTWKPDKKEEKKKKVYTSNLYKNVFMVFKANLNTEKKKRNKRRNKINCQTNKTVEILFVYEFKIIRKQVHYLIMSMHIEFL